MKKLSVSIISAALIFSLAACGSRSASAEDIGAESQSSSTETTGTAASEEPTIEEAEIVIENDSEMAGTEAGASETEGLAETTGDGGEISNEENAILVAYFSWSGNTEQMAQIIAEETGADLFEIAPAAPYTDDYNELLDIAQQEQADNARPELAAQVENWDSYDTVFVGYPNWWSDAPMAVYTFLESSDWTGKTLIPFNTSASGGFGRSLSGIEESAAGAEIMEGLDLTESELSDAENRISEWLTGLSLKL